MTAHDETPGRPRDGAGGGLAVLLAWTVVLIPAAWGVAQTIAKAAALFRTGPLP